MAAPIESVFDVESFIREYYDAWAGTDMDCIMSYYADDVVLQIPGAIMEGKEAVAISSPGHLLLRFRETATL